jgi:hypothetical protein
VTDSKTYLEIDPAVAHFSSFHFDLPLGARKIVLVIPARILQPLAGSLFSTRRVMSNPGSVLPLILVRSKKLFIIPVLQAVTECNFFEKNPALTVSPYWVQSPISLSIFR